MIGTLLFYAMIGVGAGHVTLGEHPGGLDANGCHTNRRTGDYHCHRTQTARPQPRATASPRSAGSVYYRNCDAVRAAGAAPLRRGQPGYRAGLDRDNDGIACER